jgi:hypothetical protein
LLLDEGPGLSLSLSSALSACGFARGSELVMVDWRRKTRLAHGRELLLACARQSI